ncbi:PREDICTED: forkhead box protein G1 [Chinchilla lanigera]|uniref:forkhead box protein G1 n=1 Tax=Chinchilla lanigera TaxID=34839 RepID=UPI000696B3F9|nr:PREDICTED: forkhead box protein G1 [Chinchilla lanigera]
MSLGTMMMSWRNTGDTRVSVTRRPLSPGGSRQRSLPRRAAARGRLTPGDPPKRPHPPHCPPARPTRTTFPEVRGGPRAGPARAGAGPARAAALGQCGAPRGGHVPLFGAFVRAQVCWCSECGQAARTKQVGAGLSEKTTAAARREGRGGREGPGGAVAAAPSVEGDRRGRGAPSGWRAGVAPFV